MRKKTQFQPGSVNYDEVRWKTDNNKKGKCAGCSCSFRKSENQVPGTVMYTYDHFKWCEFCYKRRKKGIPIRGTQDKRIIKPSQPQIGTVFQID